MDTLKRQARVAGFLYLVVVITGPFLLLYVPGKLFVPGDATATARNILAHEGLFRAYIVTGIVGELFFVATILALYRLLREVGPQLAALMVISILIDVPLAILSLANNVAVLAFVRGAEILAAFDPPQRDALATLLIEVDRQGILVSEVFWGMWLLPLGILIVRSGFLPRWLGIWIFANGIAYLAISLTGLLVPEQHKTITNVAMPILFGEMALMLWLLIVGARPRPRAPAPA